MTAHHRRAGGSPPKQPGGARKAIIDLLEAARAERRTLTIGDLRTATGYARGSVDREVFLLRSAQHPCLDGLRILRVSHYTPPKKTESAMTDPVKVVRSGIDSRTALELAWAGEK